MVLGVGGLQRLLPATSRHSQFMVTFYDLCWPSAGVAQVGFTHVRDHRGSGEGLKGQLSGWGWVSRDKDPVNLKVQGQSLWGHEIPRGS